MEELSCQEFVELVTDYLEGALASAERARFEEHLVECPGCHTYLEQIRLTVSVTGATADLERAPELSGLLAAFRDWKRAS